MPSRAVLNCLPCHIYAPLTKHIYKHKNHFEIEKSENHYEIRFFLNLIIRNYFPGSAVSSLLILINANKQEFFLGKSVDLPSQEQGPGS